MVCRWWRWRHQRGQVHFKWLIVCYNHFCHHFCSLFCFGACQCHLRFSIAFGSSLLCQSFLGVECQLRSLCRCGFFFGFGLCTRLLSQGFVCGKRSSFFGRHHIRSRLFFSGFVQRLRQGVEQRGANVAGHSHAFARTFQQLARQ